MGRSWVKTAVVTAERGGIGSECVMHNYSAMCRLTWKQSWWVHSCNGKQTATKDKNNSHVRWCAAVLGLAADS